MASRHYLKSSVVRSAIVAVQTNCNHPSDYVERGLDMNGAMLAGPITETGNFSPLINGDNAILMPAKIPVRTGSLVKEYEPNRSGAIAQIAPRNATQLIDGDFSR